MSMPHTGQTYPGVDGYPARSHEALRAASPYLASVALDMHRGARELVPDERHAAVAPWEIWQPTPTSADQVPSVVKVGTAILEGSPETPPVVMPMLGRRHIALPQAQWAGSMARNILTRTEWSHLPGTFKIDLYDLDGRFNDFNGLMDIGLLEHIPRGRLEAKLAELAELQHYIKTGRTGKQGPALRHLLVVNGLPELSATARKDLDYLVSSGTEWGGLLSIGGDVPASPWVQTGVPGGVRLSLDPQPPSSVVKRAVKQTTDAVERERDRPFNIAELNEGPLWGESAANGIKILLGRDMINGRYALGALDDETPHWFVGGRTGSGKSVALNAFLSSIAKRYGPDEVRFYYMDGAGPGAAVFGTGAGDSTFMPHAEVLAPNMVDPEFGIEVLRKLKETVAERLLMLNKVHGENFSDLRRGYPGRKMPRLVLAWDEIHVLLTDEQWGSEAGKEIAYLTKMGRKVGFHMIASTQETESLYALWSKNGTMQQFAMRIALRGSRDLMDIRNNVNLYSQVTERGVAWINNNAGEGPEPHNIVVRIADARNQYVKALKGSMQRRIPAGARPPMVYDGAVRPVLEHSERYRRLTPVSGRPVAAMVGNEFATEERASEVDMSDEHGRNLLILGTRSKEAAGVVRTAALSLSKQHKPGNDVKFSIVCADRRQASAASELAGMLRQSGHQTALVDDKSSAGFIATTAQELPPLDSGQKHYVFVYGADRLPGGAGEAFRALADHGPARGTHLTVSSSSIAQTRRALGGGYGADPLPLFETRMLFDATNDDVIDVIGRGYDWKPSDRPDRAILADERGEARVMVPFAP